jgi:serine recombinase
MCRKCTVNKFLDIDILRKQARVIGYARVSTQDQSLDMQIDALVKYGVPRERIYEDVMSGTKGKRPGLEAAVKACRNGDVLVVWKLDRLGRSLTNVLRTVEYLEQAGVKLWSLTESLDTRTPMGKAMFNILLVIAQLERDLISERTKAGLAAARERGAAVGRQKAMTESKVKIARAMMEQAKTDSTITKPVIARRLKVSVATIYNWLQAEAVAAQMSADPLDDII